MYSLDGGSYSVVGGLQGATIGSSSLSSSSSTVSPPLSSSNNASSSNTDREEETTRNTLLLTGLADGEHKLRLVFFFLQRKRGPVVGSLFCLVLK